MVTSCRDPRDWVSKAVMSLEETLSSSKKRWLFIPLPPLAIVTLFLLTGWAETSFGKIFGDLLGFLGAIALLFATALSLPNRERAVKVAELAVATKDDYRPEVQEALQSAVRKFSRRDNLREWRMTVVGAALLCTSFGISLARDLLEVASV